MFEFGRPNANNNDWIWAIYDEALNRNNISYLAKHISLIKNGTFNTHILNKETDIIPAFLGLAKRLSGRQIRIVQMLEERACPIAPETFANCTSIWWVASGSGSGIVRGSSLIVFDDQQNILSLDELWICAGAAFGFIPELKNQELHSNLAT